MKRNPFQSIPNARFFLRIGAPAAGVFFLGAIAMGVFARAPEVRAHLPPSRDPQAFASGRPLRVALAQFRDFRLAVAAVPEPCWSGEVKSDFQAGQCAEGWRKLGVSALVTASPLLLAALFAFLTWDSLQLTYRRLRKRVEKGMGAFTARVTEPAELSNDLFGYFYCMRAISVQLGSGHQARVYVPLKAAIPAPGEKVAVIDAGWVLGRKRYVAMTYAPHVAVVSGG
ncbi:MAG: hypothetical protein NDJ89_15925 [Oligoflexia bacterium]|nr:hypothetical protein [Oligoflexia bacterium]